MKLLTTLPAAYNRKSTKTDVDSVAERMRDEDREEAYALGYTPRQALEAGFFYSQPCSTVVRTEDDLPIAMWGVVPAEHNARVGHIWMLGTPELTNTPAIKLRFLKECKEFLEYLLEVYPVLTNQIDSRNKFHLEFIEWLGFDVYNRTEPEVFGGVDFFAFRITPELYKERWCK